MDLVGLDLANSVQSCLRTAPSPEMLARIESGKLRAKAGEGFYRWTPARVEERKRPHDEGIARGLKHIDEDVWG